MIDPSRKKKRASETKRRRKLRSEEDVPEGPPGPEPSRGGMLSRDLEDLADVVRPGSPKRAYTVEGRRTGEAEGSPDPEPIEHGGRKVADPELQELISGGIEYGPKVRLPLDDDDLGVEGYRVRKSSPSRSKGGRTLEEFEAEPVREGRTRRTARAGTRTPAAGWSRATGSRGTSTQARRKKDAPRAKSTTRSAAKTRRSKRGSSAKRSSVRKNEKR
jgi:hypothetical protein